MTYDKKSIGPVISFIIWLSLFAVVCIIGISDVFAATYNATSYTAQLYDNYGPSLHSVTTQFTNMSWRGTIPSMTAYTSGAAWGISSPIPLLANHTYSMTVKIEGTYGGNLILSTYNRIGVGTSLDNAKSSYENNSNCTLNYSNSISSNMTLQFAFTPKINSNYIVFPFATTYTGDNQSFYLYDIIIDDLGSSGVNETTINNSLNNQTNELNNSITSSTNTITGAITDTENNINSNIDDMGQSIVNSNKETQQVIKDQFNTCRDSYNLFNGTPKGLSLGITTTYKNNKYILNGTMSSTYFNITNNYTTLLESGQYTLSIDRELPFDLLLLYFSDNGRNDIVILSGDKFKTFTTNGNITQYYIWARTTNSGLTFNNLEFKVQLQKGSIATEYEPPNQEICVNKLDEQNETSKGSFGKIKELFAWLTNDDDADISGAADVAGWLPAGPLDSLINLPLTMLTNINSSLKKTCSPLNVNLPYVNKSVEIPCLNTIFNQITGLNSFWTWVGMIGSVLILYRYLINLYNYYDKLTDLQANFISDWGGI